MKTKINGWSNRYQQALRKYLKQDPGSNLRPAIGLGCEAAALDLETLDVARIHERALATLESSSGRDGIFKRAQIFFAEAITPLEKTHRVALRTNVRLSQLNKTLGRRTVDLAASNRRLKQLVVQRKNAEETLKKSGKHYAKLLQESCCLQERLRHLTHHLLAAQEDKRKKISRELRDEVAQTLLGINIRLLTLKKVAAVNTECLKKEFASTQRLVGKSAKIVNRFAREFGKYHET